MCGLWQGLMGGGFLPVPPLSSLVCVSVRERWGDFTCRPDFVLPLSVPSLCPGGGLDFVPPSFAGRMSAGGASPVPSQPPHPEIGIVTPPSSCIIFFFSPRLIFSCKKKKIKLIIKCICAQKKIPLLPWGAGGVARAGSGGVAGGRGVTRAGSGGRGWGGGARAVARREGGSAAEGRGRGAGAWPGPAGPRRAWTSSSSPSASAPAPTPPFTRPTGR